MLTEDTLTSFSGHGVGTARGTNGLARWQPHEDNCLFFGGPELTVALGTKTSPPRLREEVI